MPGSKFAWTQIRQLYVAGEDSVTLESLAEDFGCHYSTIRKQAAKDKWTEARQRWRAEVEAETKAKLVTLEASRRLDMLDIAEKMRGIGFESLRRIGLNMSRDPNFRLEPQETRLLLKDATEIMRRALGIPDVVAMTDEEIDAALDAELARALSLRESSSPPTTQEEK